VEKEEIVGLIGVHLFQIFQVFI